MNDQEIVRRVIEEMNKGRMKPLDNRGMLTRFLSSLRVRFKLQPKWQPIKSVEIEGGVEF